MTDERFGKQLGELMRELEPVSDVPRAEIWAGVSAARRFRRPATRTLATWGWAVSMAAALVIGISIGRYLPSPQTEVSDGMTTAAAPSETTLIFSPAPPPAADYLANTEALLASFPVSAQKGRAPEVAGWAKQLLLDTRLLIDSPVGNDAGIVKLLQDLELVLAQIASLDSHNPNEEIQLIQDGMRQNQVLARVRLAAGTAGVNGDD